MGPVLSFFLLVFLSYLIGSIPTAVIISKLFFGFDIRKKGSGNMGSTNAFRVLGWKWGIIVQIIDILKGVVAVIVIAKMFASELHFTNLYFESSTIVMLIAGLCAVCGHIWTAFGGFRGGKGINTAAGMLIGVAPIDVSIAVGIFIIAVIFSGYISLGSISGAMALPSSLFFRYNVFGVNIPGYHILIYFVLALAALLVFAHRKNIKRLVRGTENRFAKLQLIKYKLRRIHIN